MGNVKYSEELYNEEYKNQFCEDGGYTVNSKNNALRVFKAAAETEFFLKKDLFDFNREELKRFFYSLKPRTPGGSRQNVGWVLNYINWAKEKGLTKSINPLMTVDKEWKEQFSNAEAKFLWTDVEIKSIIKKVVNYTDKAMIALLFAGVKGEENSEIVNLTIGDIDEEKNELLLKDKDGDSRFQKVNEEVIELVKKAAAQTDYDVANGDAQGHLQRVELVASRYVFKPANTNNKGNNPKSNAVFRSLSLVVEHELGNEPHFNPTQILLSGLLAKAKDVYLNKEKFEEEDAIKILEEHGLKPSAKYMSVLNLDTIKKVYGFK